MRKQEISFTSDGNIREIGEMLSEIGLDQSKVYQVYSHLLGGKALSIVQFAKLMEKSIQDTKEMLSLHGEINNQDQVIGFWGLSHAETNHKLFVGDKIIYTWCAVDTLLFPWFLNFSAEVESRDPINGKLVKLSVNEDYLQWTDPVPLYISWMEKADICDIRNSFCNYSFFFANDKTAQKWLEENRFGKISLVEDFFSLKGGLRCC